MSEAEIAPTSERSGTGGASLQIGRRRRSGLLTVLLLVVLTGAFAVWYVNNPGDLPTSDGEIAASGAVDQPVYIGVFTATGDFDRTLELSGVKVRTVADADVTVTPMLCRDGTLGVTTDPAPFCGELLNPEGQTFGPGDAIVLEVTSATAATATIDRVRLGFREGWQWGTLPAGSAAVVRIFGRDDAVDPAAPADPTDPTQPSVDPSSPSGPSGPSSDSTGPRGATA